MELKVLDDIILSCCNFVKLQAQKNLKRTQKDLSLSKLSKWKMGLVIASFVSLSNLCNCFQQVKTHSYKHTAIHIVHILKDRQVQIAVQVLY